MCWDWIYRIVYRRQIARDLREIEEMSARAHALRADLDRQIADAFTPEEWAFVQDRCERKVAAFRF